MGLKNLQQKRIFFSYRPISNYCDCHNVLPTCQVLEKVFFFLFYCSQCVVTMDCVEKIIRKDMIDPLNGKSMKNTDIIELQRGGTGKCLLVIFMKIKTDIRRGKVGLLNDI